MEKGKQKKQTRLAVLAIILIISCSAVVSRYRAESMRKLPYLEHRNDTAVTVDGKGYKLRELAFYLAYEEQTIEEQARAYNLENTREYWNVHTNKAFIRVEARDMAMSMAVHDIVFYQLAQEYELTLTTEEKRYMENQKMDFWNDLEEDGQERLGVTEEEIGESFVRMALARKAQQMLADREGVDVGEYNVNGSMYETLLEEHTYQVNEKLWKRLNFGRITVG